MNKHRTLWATAGLLAALALTGCWDDDDDPTPTPVSTEVPDSAGASTASFISFILALSSDDETSEPLALSQAFAVPDDEAAEPTPLI